MAFLPIVYRRRHKRPHGGRDEFERFMDHKDEFDMRLEMRDKERDEAAKKGKIEPAKIKLTTALLVIFGLSVPAGLVGLIFLTWLLNILKDGVIHLTK